MIDWNLLAKIVMHAFLLVAFFSFLDSSNLVLDIISCDTQPAGRTFCLIDKAFHEVSLAFSIVCFDVLSVYIGKRLDCSIMNQLCD